MTYTEWYISLGQSLHVNDIVLLQKKAVRSNITGVDLLTHCKPLVIEHEIPTVINLYVFMYFYTNQIYKTFQMETIFTSIILGVELTIPSHRLAKTGT